MCGNTHTERNSIHEDARLYKCQDYSYQFRSGFQLSGDKLWAAYQQQKQVINELSVRFRISLITIKRGLYNIKYEQVQPPLSGSGFIHLDATYWDRSFGAPLTLNTESGKPPYLSFVKGGMVKDCEGAVVSIEKRGYVIRGLIIDRKKSLLKSPSEYHIQICWFHVKQIVGRYFTQNPRMLTSRNLKAFVDRLHRIHKADFRGEYQAWKERWKGMTGHRSLYKDGRLHYTH